MYKRFILFGFFQYYPRGGLGDVAKDFDTQEEANIYITKCSYYDTYELFDRETGKIIWRKG